MYRGPVPAERIAKQYPAPTVSTECANTICTVAIVAVKSRGWEGCSMSALGQKRTSAGYSTSSSVSNWVERGIANPSANEIDESSFRIGG